MDQLVELDGVVAFVAAHRVGTGKEPLVRHLDMVG